jgi:hypothetical protein
MEFVDELVKATLVRKQGSLPGNVVELRSVNPVFVSAKERFVIRKLVLNINRNLRRAARSHNTDRVLRGPLHERVQVLGNPEVDPGDRVSHRTIGKRLGSID